MASIFTYEPEPQRVSSPWLQGSQSQPTRSVVSQGQDGQYAEDATSGDAESSGAADTAVRIKRLQPEPQDGPVEYKLHLLLRPRRKFTTTSTANRVSGSKHSKTPYGHSNRSVSESVVDPGSLSGIETPPASSTQQTRQHRLEQLTTQLLWRLQQSSPHHTSSASNIILPSLPEALPELQAPQQPAKLLHGLEESQGALYEIGVSDDGALVGLADDEMDESLNNIRAMAACLGCGVEILRREHVGLCEWVEDVMIDKQRQTILRSGALSVVEALVKPALLSTNGSSALKADSAGQAVLHKAYAETEQLRITLTGPTMSGKSSLLGTLTTSTLDNGRGTSRLSMLKHRHEINSGVTSSVNQELLGYSELPDREVGILNYNTENMASWIDIHNAARGSRLMLITDSAGHPRYRRTTVRGLTGCAPHWTLMCFPADNSENDPKTSSTTSAIHPSGSATSDADLSFAQLDLCLKLGLRLVVVITKLDLASRSGLKTSLTKVLDTLKAAGKKPVIMPNASGDNAEHPLEVIAASSIESAYNVVLPLLNDPVESVPIVLTSAVQGTGIQNLHALLHELPIPDDQVTAQQPSPIFHVEDTFRKPAEVDGIILSGILRHQRVKVGDGGFLGPFAVNDLEESEDSEDRPTRRSKSLPTSRSFPGALRVAQPTSRHFHLPNQEWRRSKVVSIRNLRLPVHSLLPDQAGTLAVVPDHNRQRHETVEPFGRIRKGMVFTTIQPIAARSFVAEFVRDDLESLAVGNHVVVYTASVRASARVVSARAPDTPQQSPTKTFDSSESDELFGIDTLQVSGGESAVHRVAGSVTAPTLLVTFRFNASKECLVVGAQVLVMPGGGPGLYGGQERGEKGVAGLDGFVGTIKANQP